MRYRCTRLYIIEGLKICFQINVDTQLNALRVIVCGAFSWAVKGGREFIVRKIMNHTCGGLNSMENFCATSAWVEFEVKKKV